MSKLPDSKLQESIAQIRKMASDDPENELGHFRLGKLLMEAEQYAEATGSLRRTLELNPQFSKVYQLLGTCLVELGQKADAIKVLRDGYAVADERGDNIPRDEMAKMLVQLGEPAPTANAAKKPKATGGDGFHCRVDPKDGNTVYATLQYGVLYLGTDDGLFMARIFAAFAAKESGRRSARQKRKTLANAEAGLPHGGFRRPFGYEDDKVTVARARKIQRFLSQPFFVAEAFTGTSGRYVKLEDSIKGFKMIVNGELDELPEQAFYMRGTIDETIAAGEKII